MWAEAEVRRESLLMVGSWIGDPWLPRRAGKKWSLQVVITANWLSHDFQPQILSVCLKPVRDHVKWFQVDGTQVHSTYIFFKGK